ncbi:O-antigen ligase family protein [Pusillimonas sp. CC-YST705]|uniref:O-antigen ligase family protein n=1 Tax=Mesopusillimonas faecipullorum TaxID=2755040 RepID=A0ABS8CFL8_9BURK|nr:O-antigen ligase family protein [Mesopusillimonas faecipullorum]MCB5364835.1 O-antigen ligase family protein [Mesopusillimonas faecipullorum]
MPSAASAVSSGMLAQRYTCLAVFLFFSISLVVPSGYSVGSALLFLAGLTVLARPGVWPELQREDKRLLWVFGLFFLGWALEIWLDGQSSSRFDKSVRIVCAMVALLWLLRHAPKAACFWGGIAAGAIAVGVWSGWQRWILGMESIEGYTLIIQFGNIAMLLGMMSLAGVGWAWFDRRSSIWSAWLLLGFFSGLAASFLSGSRGGWIGAPLVLLLILFGYRDRLPKYLLSGFVALMVLLVAVLYQAPSTGVQQRVELAVSDVQLYLDQARVDTSVGARFEMWRTGLLIARESPLIGMGGQGMQRYMETLVEEGKVDPIVTNFGHLHNEYVDMTARRGLIGLGLLLALYLVPLAAFAGRMCSSNVQARPYALAGAVLCVSYICYGLSQTFLSHNSGVMVYFFGVVICWSMVRRYD